MIERNVTGGLFQKGRFYQFKYKYEMFIYQFGTINISTHLLVPFIVYKTKQRYIRIKSLCKFHVHNYLDDESEAFYFKL